MHRVHENDEIDAREVELSDTRMGSLVGRSGPISRYFNRLAMHIDACAQSTCREPNTRKDARRQSPIRLTNNTGSMYVRRIPETCEMAYELYAEEQYTERHSVFV